MRIGKRKQMQIASAFAAVVIAIAGLPVMRQPLSSPQTVL